MGFRDNKPETAGLICFRVKYGLLKLTAKSTNTFAYLSQRRSGAVTYKLYKNTPRALKRSGGGV